MMKLKTIPVVGRVAAYVENYVSERKKREYRDFSHEHRCYMAGEEAYREFENVKERALIETRPAFYR